MRIYTKKAVLLLSALLIFLLSSNRAEASISVTLKLDRKEATRADSIKMVVSVSGTRKSKSSPIVKGLKSFSITKGGTSSRVEIINSKVSSSIDYTYLIQPGKTGIFTIGPAKITIKKKAYQSNQVTLTVTESSRSANIDDRGPIFLSASLSSQNVYLEEQIIYTLKLYRLTKVSNVSLSLPEIKHLTFKQLANPYEYQSVYNGQSYQILEVSYALIPSREGKYEINPSKMHMNVFQPRRRSSRSMFDDPFFNDPFFSFSSGKPLTVTSEPLELRVSPLPVKGMPANFSGLVGSFKIDSRLEPSKINTGESSTLTILLKGKGNVSRIPDLKIPEMDHVKVYADQPVLKIESDTEGIRGLKTMKWALVPEIEGRYQISPLSITFFDTKSHQYRSIKTSSHSLNVLPGKKKQVQTFLDGGRKDTGEGSAKREVKELGRDILPVHTSIKDLPIRSQYSIKGFVFWTILLVPFLLYSIAFGSVKFGKKTDKSLAALKSRKAAKNFIRQYRHGRLSSNDLALSIRDYLNNRFSLSMGSLTPNEAKDILQSRGVSPATALKLQSILRSIEDAVFTGENHISQDIGKDLPQLVGQIEKEIR